MVAPEALVMAPPARLMGLLPKNSAGLTQLSRNFSSRDTAEPPEPQELLARLKEKPAANGGLCRRYFRPR
jgi:hypothetical protein